MFILSKLLVSDSGLKIYVVLHSKAKEIRPVKFGHFVGLHEKVFVYVCNSRI